MIYTVPATANRWTDPKQIDAESKLYHSDFHTIKLYYDSFEKTIDCERFLDIQSMEIPLTFKTTSTINSKFGFKTEIDSVANYTHESDYDNYLMVSRNNEETIMNSEYINYIKNGYNYDKKANALSIKNAMSQTGLSVLGSLASVAAAPATGGLSLLSGVNFASSAISSLSSLRNMQKAQDIAMAQKLAQLSYQAASVAGSDDVDLMSWYSDNKLHIVRYDVPQFVKRSLYRAFDLTGYAQEKYGTPSVDSRVYYNFIQCDPIFQKQGFGKWKQVWLDDIRAKYQAGVTVMHKVGVSWNLEQDYENWENWIITGISE